MWTMSSPKGVQNNHMAVPFKVAKQETTPELSRTFRTLPPDLYTPARTGTLRNPPEPTQARAGTLEPSGIFRNPHRHTLELACGTYTGTFRKLPPEPAPAHTGTRNRPELASGTHTSTWQHTPEPGIVRNLPPEPTPAHAGTLRNLPEPASGTYTVTRQNSPEPSGTCLRTLHRHTLELSGTFRNLHREPTPAHTGTLRNLPESTSGTFTGTHRNPPEPSSGTCSCDPHRHTPKLSGLKTPLAYAVGEK